MNTRIQEIDDISDAIRECRPFHKAKAYRMRFALEDLNFQDVEVTDPVPLGRQILEAAGCDVREGYSLYAILSSGDFEDVRLDEKIDLWQKGVERFIAFNSGTEYKFQVNDRELKWGKREISGNLLYELAGVSSTESLFLEVPGGTDTLIDTSAVIDLSENGVERFITVPNQQGHFEIIINGSDYVIKSKFITYEEIVQLAFPGQHGPTIIFSMVYSNAAGQPSDGELGAGGTIEIKEGKETEVTVTKTDRS